MPNFKPDNYNQDTMLVVNFLEQLHLDPFALTLHHLIDNKIDLSDFYAKYHNDFGGRQAYKPSILLKIVLYAYYKGIKSSREMQWQCEHNVIFNALACGAVPHFTLIAAFVSGHPQEITSIFEQVLLVCDEQGLLGHELIAIDGCKLPSNAAKEHSGTHKELTEKRTKIKKYIETCMEEQLVLDKRKPREKERSERIDKTLEKLNAQFDKIDTFLKTASPRMGQGKRPKEVKSNITDNESAKMKTSKGTIQGYNGVAAVDKKHQIIVDAQAFGDGQEHHTLKPILESIDEHYQSVNIHADILRSDIVITADTGFANDENYEYLEEEGINAVIPDQNFRERDPRFTHQKEKYGKRHQDRVKGVAKLIPASEFTFNKKKKTCLCPEGKDMWLKNEVKHKGKIKLFFEGHLTDCRHCPIKEDCMRNPSSADTRTGHGRQVSITYTNGRTPADKMKRRVDSVQGKEIYKERMATVEPVFANIRSNKRLDGFSLRGKKKVDAQWKLYCMVHNIEKVMNYGQLH